MPKERSQQYPRKKKTRLSAYCQLSDEPSLRKAIGLGRMEQLRYNPVCLVDGWWYHWCTDRGSVSKVACKFGVSIASESVVWKGLPSVLIRKTTNALHFRCNVFLEQIKFGWCTIIWSHCTVITCKPIPIATYKRCQVSRMWEHHSTLVTKRTTSTPVFISSTS